MKEKLVALTKEAERHGYTLVASDCYRTAQQQAEGRKKKGNLCAKPYESAHQYGCAFDLVLFDPNGKEVNIKKVPWFYNYAKNELDLFWLYDVKPVETWHFERKGWNKPGSSVYSEYCNKTGKTPKRQRQNFDAMG